MLHKLTDIPADVPLERVLDRLLAKEPEDIEIVSQLFADLSGVIKPKALFREVFVEEIVENRVKINGYTFESDVLAANFAGVHRLFAYVATSGTEADEWQHGIKDHVSSLWVDMIKQMYLVEAGSYLREYIKKTFQYEKLQSVNPGSGNLDNWPISQQAILFEMIGDVKGEIGVTLTDSFLMIPLKSTSGILYPSETDYSNCALCGRENCPGRRTAFDAELYKKIFKTGDNK